MFSFLQTAKNNTDSEFILHFTAYQTKRNNYLLLTQDHLAKKQDITMVLKNVILLAENSIVREYLGTEFDRWFCWENSRKELFYSTGEVDWKV